MHDLHVGDCRKLLRKMKSESVHMVLTDPPYFIDGLDNMWSKGKTKSTGVVGGLPVGMKFDKNQGKQLEEFMNPIAKELFRILKPGSFALIFSMPRLTHRMGVAFEDAGFEIRDLYAWRFTKKAQFKAFSMNHFVKKRNIPEEEQEAIIKLLDNRKTPQLRPQFESIICAQKPRKGTFIDNYVEYEVGLVDTSQTLDGNVPSTIMTVEKETDKKHLAAKPVKLCEHLIKLFSASGQIILDPFVGSGTTCVAATNVNRRSIGIDVDSMYINIAKERLNV